MICNQLSSTDMPHLTDRSSHIIVFYQPKRLEAAGIEMLVEAKAEAGFFGCFKIFMRDRFASPGSSRPYL